jgi:hypothetical protein
MVQKNINEEENEWEKDETYDDAEVIKLGINESIQGILVDRFQSAKYEVGIYKIKDKDDDHVKIIMGTTVLDKLMKPKELGEIVMIKRLEDGKTQDGRIFQNYETYHLHHSSSKKNLG